MRENKLTNRPTLWYFPEKVDFRHTAEVDMFPYKSLPFPENVDKGAAHGGVGQLVGWSVFFTAILGLVC